MKNKELFEKLAAIEHERWGDWQKYMHSKCVKVIDVNGVEEIREVTIPVELYKQWERQINTEYKDLTEAEKDSDREQVKRYWDLLD